MEDAMIVSRWARERAGALAGTAAKFGAYCHWNRQQHHLHSAHDAGEFCENDARRRVGQHADEPSRALQRQVSGAHP